MHISKLYMHPKIPLAAALSSGLEHIPPYIKFLLIDILISLSCLVTQLHEGSYESLYSYISMFYEIEYTDQR